MEVFGLGIYVAGTLPQTTIQASINAAAKNPRGVVWIKADYQGTDTYTNPSNVPIFDMRGAGSLSFAAGGVTLAGNNVWTGLNTFSLLLKIFRYQISGATVLSSSNFALAGWGSGASMSAIRGTDQAHTFTITAGSSPTIDPTIQLTFADGVWAFAPVVLAQTIGGTGMRGFVDISANTSTYTLTYNGLPISGSTYVFNVLMTGSQS